MTEQVERLRQLVLLDMLERLHAGAMALAQADPKAFLAWHGKATLHVAYDEHEGVFVVGVRKPDGEKAVLAAVSVDRKDPETFGRPFDDILLAAAAAAFKTDGNTH